MGRFRADEANNYGGSGGSNFFSLRDNGDTARVRFMYNSMKDVVGYAIHEVTIDGKRRPVNCLREYNEPKSKCPLCASGNFQRAKLYIPLFDIDSGEVKIWERGKNFFQKISALCARYSSADVPLVAHTFDVERHGAKGDTATTYEIFETGSDDTRLEDLPEIPEVLGSIILEKSYDDLAFYAENEYFPSGAGLRRNSTGEPNPDRPVGRRTPSMHRGEAF